MTLRRSLPAIRSMLARRHAFALPLVFIAVMVSGMIAALLIEQSSASMLTVQAEVRSYEIHHRRAGMTEMVSAWLMLATSRSSVLDQVEHGTGLAFSMDLPGNRQFRVYFADGQGAVLRPNVQVRDRLPSQYEEITEELLIALEPLAQEEQEKAALERIVRSGFRIPAGTAPGEWFGDLAAQGVSEYLRGVGPTAVSANAAREDVLRELVRTVVRSGDPDRFVSEIIDKRTDERITTADIDQFAADANFDDADKRMLRAFLTADPTLWLVRAETVKRGNVVEAGVGLMLLENRRAMAVGGGPFLWWRDIPVGR